MKSPSIKKQNTFARPSWSKKPVESSVNQNEELQNNARTFNSQVKSPSDAELKENVKNLHHEDRFEPFKDNAVTGYNPENDECIINKNIFKCGSFKDTSSNKEKLVVDTDVVLPGRFKNTPKVRNKVSVSDGNKYEPSTEEKEQNGYHFEHDQDFDEVDSMNVDENNSDNSFEKVSKAVTKGKKRTVVRRKRYVAQGNQGEAVSGELSVNTFDFNAEDDVPIIPKGGKKRKVDGDDDKSVKSSEKTTKKRKIEPEVYFTNAYDSIIHFTVEYVVKIPIKYSLLMNSSVFYLLLYYFLNHNYLCLNPLI